MFQFDVSIILGNCNTCAIATVWKRLITLIITTAMMRNNKYLDKRKLQLGERSERAAT